MKKNKYMTLMVGGVVALVLLVVAGVFLQRKHRQYRDVIRVLRSEEQQLQQINQRDPFPSPENLEIQQENMETLQQQLDQMLVLVRQDQLEVPEMEAADFGQFLETVQRDLIQRARRSGTMLPERPSFGFPRYFEGERPSPEHIPRLVRQMKMVELLCRELFDARITSLDGVTRQTFDAPQDAAIGGRGRERESAFGVGETAQDEEKRHDMGLYAWETFTVEFTAREPSLWSIIERITRSAIPMRIVSLSVVTDETTDLETGGRLRRQDPRIGRRPTLPPGRDPETGLTDMRRRALDPLDTMGEEVSDIPPREQRIVQGRELITVVMKVNVYRFLDDGEEGERSL